MGRRRYRGSITIFLSLMLVLFLSVVCTVLEGIRIQGSKVRAVACLDLGLFSIFGEYERELLSLYHVFFLDGSYGTGSLDGQKIEGRLRFFMSQNADLSHTEAGIDWFRVRNTQTNIKEYFLATDERGKGFLQQASLFMIGIPEFGEKITKIGAEEGKSMQEKVQLFHRIRQTVENEWKYIDLDEKESFEIDPMEWLERKQSEDILQQVIPFSFPMSSREVSYFEKVSERPCNQGIMTIPTVNETEQTELFFRYLFFTFGNAAKTKERKSLLYELEYLLGGKKSDVENLKKICEEILEIRFADNFLTATEDQEKKEKVKEMIIVWKREEEKKQKEEKEGKEQKNQEVTDAEIEAFLLAWAYQESLLDVQKLFKGGCVPIQKNGRQWQETEVEFWKKGQIDLSGEESMEGWNYEEYLKLLFEMKKDFDLVMKTLDLVEWELRSREETSYFRADCCIGGMTVETQWQIDPVFFRVSSAFMGIGQAEIEYKAEGSFWYEMEE